jgi:hypothetical protein
VFKGWFPTAREEEFLKTNLDQLQVDGLWHINGQHVVDSKILALGRSCYYIPFIKTLVSKLRKQVYQYDLP